MELVLDSPGMTEGYQARRYRNSEIPAAYPELWSYGGYLPPHLRATSQFSSTQYTPSVLTRVTLSSNNHYRSSTGTHYSSSTRRESSTIATSVHDVPTQPANTRPGRQPNTRPVHGPAPPQTHGRNSRPSASETTRAPNQPSSLSQPNRRRSRRNDTQNNQRSHQQPSASQNSHNPLPINPATGLPISKRAARRRRAKERQAAAAAAATGNGVQPPRSGPPSDVARVGRPRPTASSRSAPPSQPELPSRSVLPSKLVTPSRSTPPSTTTSTRAAPSRLGEQNDRVSATRTTSSAVVSTNGVTALTSREARATAPRVHPQLSYHIVTENQREVGYARSARGLATRSSPSSTIVNVSGWDNSEDEPDIDSELRRFAGESGVVPRAPRQLQILDDSEDDFDFGGELRLRTGGLGVNPWAPQPSVPGTSLGHENRVRPQPQPQSQPRRIVNPPCSICFDIPDQYPYLGPTLACTHTSICEPCLEQHISYSVLTEGLTVLSCPDPACRRTLEYADVVRGVRSNQTCLDRYEALVLRRTLEKLPNFVWCKNPACDWGQVHESRDAAPIVICQVCHARSCFTHDVPWHTGLTCEQYTATCRAQRAQEDAASQAYISGYAKVCPNPSCGRRIEKADGCDHMTCRRPAGCGHEFCWLCLADYRRILREGNHRHNSNCLYYFPITATRQTYDGAQGNWGAPRAWGTQFGARTQPESSRWTTAFWVILVFCAILFLPAEG